MRAAYAVPSMASPPQEVVATRADSQTPMSRSAASQSDSRWNDHIVTLLDWLRDPQQLSDEGVDPPAQTIIRLALDYSEYLRSKARCPAPTRIAPDANGGIVFVLSHVGGTEEIHFWDSGTVEYFDFAGNQLKARREVSW